MSNIEPDEADSNAMKSKHEHYTPGEAANSTPANSSNKQPQVEMQTNSTQEETMKSSTQQPHSEDPQSNPADTRVTEEQLLSACDAVSRGSSNPEDPNAQKAAAAARELLRRHEEGRKSELVTYGALKWELYPLKRLTLDAVKNQELLRMEVEDVREDLSLAIDQTADLRKKAEPGGEVAKGLQRIEGILGSILQGIKTASANATLTNLAAAGLTDPKTVHGLFIDAINQKMTKDPE